MCVWACTDVCMCVCMHIIMWGGGVVSCNLNVVAPGTLVSAMLIARQGSDRLVSRSDPCASVGVLKLLKQCQQGCVGPGPGYLSPAVGPH